MTDNRCESRRKPWFAVLLSLFFPALGIVYAGSFWLAIAALALTAAALLTSYFILLYGPAWMMQWYLEYVVIIVIDLAVLAITYRLAYTNRINYKLRTFNRVPVYVGMALVEIALIAYALPTVLYYKFYRVPTASMQNGLLLGERFIASRYTDEAVLLERGDIVVHLYPVNRSTVYVKRCVGLPGDTILITDKHLTVNSTPEPILQEVIFVDTAPDGSQHILQREEDGRDSRDNFGPYVVPENSIFVLGDNRDNTSDSRYWGPVPAELILAKAIRITTSPDRKRIGRFL